MKIFFSAGEPSGDVHGANLIRELHRRRSDLEFVGFGGPLMRDAGCDLLVDLTALAVMWLLRVIINLHKFLALAGRADRYFRHQRPDAVVLIDYPGFNWWIARRAKAHGIPVFYYAPPQIWAWASWRIEKMRRLVDHVLCALPFEARWFAERGCNATFVGHPFFDEVERKELDAVFVAKHRDQSRPLVTILPGSRTQEVTHNLHYFLRAVRLIRAQVPQARFAIASFKPHQSALARQAVAETGMPIEVFTRRTPELIELADCCLATSGSVSLELLHAGKPTAILYWISPFAFAVQKRFRRVKYITLVNLLAKGHLEPPDEEPVGSRTSAPAGALFPEYLTCEDKSSELANHVIGWLKDRVAREQLVGQLTELKKQIGHSGAAATSAEYILDELARRAPGPPRPHYIPSASRLTAEAIPHSRAA